MLFSIRFCDIAQLKLSYYVTGAVYDKYCLSVMFYRAINRHAVHNINYIIIGRCTLLHGHCLCRFAESGFIANEYNTSNETVPCILSLIHLSSNTEYLVTVAVILLNGTQGPPSPELRLRTTVSS